MAKVTGISFLVKVGATPAAIGSQRGGTLTLTQGTADASDKQGGGWEEKLKTLRGASFSCDGAVVTGDVPYEAVKAAIEGGTALNGQVEEPDGTTYTGDVICTNFTRNGPYDGTYTYSADFVFSGEPTIA